MILTRFLVEKLFTDRKRNTHTSIQYVLLISLRSESKTYRLYIIVYTVIHTFKTLDTEGPSSDSAENFEFFSGGYFSQTSYNVFRISLVGGEKKKKTEQ